MTTRAEMDAFLLGEGPLDGAWFNSAPGRRPYWWRTHLQAVRQAEGSAIAAAMNAAAIGPEHTVFGVVVTGPPSSEPPAYGLGDLRPDGAIVIASDAYAVSGTVWVTPATADRAAAHGWTRNGVSLEGMGLVQIYRDEADRLARLTPSSTSG
jgi:hypothetical protein